MKLFSSPTSPFVRKVLVLAHEAGLYEKLGAETVVTLPTTPHTDLGRVNPLSKIPALVTDEGETLYDSRVICEYLDGLHGGPRFVPESGPARFRTLRVQALSDGLLDAGILVRYERLLRPADRQWDEWERVQLDKVRRALDVLELEARVLPAAPERDLGFIAAACALGWLEFRRPLADLRDGRPALFEWYDAFRRRASMRATEPRDPT
jgi:glutathione S-transferase